MSTRLVGFLCVPLGGLFFVLSGPGWLQSLLPTASAVWASWDSGLEPSLVHFWPQRLATRPLLQGLGLQVNVPAIRIAHESVVPNLWLAFPPIRWFTWGAGRENVRDAVYAHASCKKPGGFFPSDYKHDI